MTHITVDQERMSTLSCVDLKIVLAISHVSSKIHLSAFFSCVIARQDFFFTKSRKIQFLLRGSSKFYDKNVEVVPPRPSLLRR